MKCTNHSYQDCVISERFHWHVFLCHFPWFSLDLGFQQISLALLCFLLYWIFSLAPICGWKAVSEKWLLSPRLELELSSAETEIPQKTLPGNWSHYQSWCFPSPDIQLAGGCFLQLLTGDWPCWTPSRAQEEHITHHITQNSVILWFTIHLTLLMGLNLVRKQLCTPCTEIF